MLTACADRGAEPGRCGVGAMRSAPVVSWWYIAHASPALKQREVAWDGSHRAGMAVRRFISYHSKTRYIIRNYINRKPVLKGILSPAASFSTRVCTGMNPPLGRDSSVNVVIRVCHGVLVRRYVCSTVQAALPAIEDELTKACPSLHTHGRIAGGSRGDFIHAETLIHNGTAGENGPAGGTLHQPVPGSAGRV